MVDKLEPITEEQWQSVNEENRRIVKEFLDQSTHMSDYSLGQYKSCLMIYFCWIKDNCNNKPFYEIKGREYLLFQNWLSNRGLSSSAIKLKRSVISSLNNYIEMYYLDEYKNFRNYINKRVPQPPKAFVNTKNPLTLEEQEHLCQVLEEKGLYQQLAYVRFAFSSGCRRNETRQLLKNVIDAKVMIKDVETKDKDGNKIIVQSKSFLTGEIRCKGRGKAGKVRRLQFDQIAMDAIKKWLEVRGDDECPYVFVTIHGDTIKQIALETANLWFKEIFEPIVGRRFHPHALREGRVTTLIVEQGKDISVAQKLLGHQSSETTKIYLVKDDNDASNEAFT
jgi:integrase